MFHNSRAVSVSEKRKFRKLGLHDLLLKHIFSEMEPSKQPKLTTPSALLSSIAQATPQSNALASQNSTSSTSQPSKPKKTAMISEGRKKVHTVLEDGSQLVEVIYFLLKLD
jgi:hypothetical protein